MCLYSLKNYQLNSKLLAKIEDLRNIYILLFEPLVCFTWLHLYKTSWPNESRTTLIFLRKYSLNFWNEFLLVIIPASASHRKRTVTDKEIYFFGYIWIFIHKNLLLALKNIWKQELSHLVQLIESYALTYNSAIHLYL